MKIDYREIEITEEQRAEVEAAMTALYAVCDGYRKCVRCAVVSHAGT